MIPVVLGDQVPAVLELASSRLLDGEDELFRVLEHIGTALGQVIERKQNEERIRELAYYDGLTGLPNRELFLRRLHQTLGHAEEASGQAALLFIDLDGFKRINDTLGHSAGDALLRGVSERLSATVRSSDVLGRRNRADGDSSISRLGGDEFTVLLGDLASPQDAAFVASRTRVYEYSPISGTK